MRAGPGTTWLAAAGILLAAAASAADYRLLAPHGQAEIPAGGRFVAAEMFREGTAVGDRVLGVVSWNFARHFLGVVETGVPAATLNAWTLRYAADDGALLARLAEEGEPVLPLAAVHRLMQRAGKGGSHTDGQSNVAYARAPAGGKLWAIHWTVNHAGEWVIGAAAVPHPQLDWPAGTRAFSRGPANEAPGLPTH